MGNLFLSDPRQLPVSQNISNLFRQMCVTSFLSIGMVLVIVTGGIDLSVGKLAGFVSVVAAYLQFYVWFKYFPDQVRSCQPYFPSSVACWSACWLV